MNGLDAGATRFVRQFARCQQPAHLGCLQEKAMVKNQDRNSRKRAHRAQREEKMRTINELCDTVRETAYAIHVYHGHGHLEKVYENALVHRLRKLGLDVKQQHPIKVFDEDSTLIGEFSADLLVEDQLVVELKAAKALADEHVAQLLGYLKSTRLEHGLLINFGSYKFQIKKYIRSDRLPTAVACSPSAILRHFFAFFGFFRG